MADVRPGWFMVKDVQLNGIYDASYTIPAEIKINCSREDQCCHLCPVMLEDADRKYTVSPDNPEIVALVGVGAESETAQLRKLCRVPPKCSSFAYETLTQTPVRLCSLSPEKANKQTNMLAVVFDNLESGNLGVNMDVAGFHAKTIKGTPAYFITDIIGASKSINGFELSDDDEAELSAAPCVDNSDVEAIEAKLTRPISRLVFQRHTDLQLAGPTPTV